MHRTASIGATGPLVAVAGVVAVVVLVAAVSPRSAWGGGRGADAVGASPAAPPAALARAADAVDAAGAAGAVGTGTASLAVDRGAAVVTLADGTTFGPGFAHEGIVAAPGPWVDWDVARGVAAWPARLRARVTHVVPGERFTEEAYVGATPAPCYAFHRTVTGVDVGIDGPVGAAIERELLAWLEPPYFAGEVASDDDPRCRDRPRGQYGFALEEVGRVACALPDGPAVRCFVVAQWAWHLGEADVRRVAHLTFDRATGALLDGEALHPGVTLAEVDAQVSRLVCAAGGRCAPLAIGIGQAHPTLAGLVVDFSPGEAADVSMGTRRLVVPWASLAASAG